MYMSISRQEFGRQLLSQGRKIGGSQSDIVGLDAALLQVMLRQAVGYLRGVAGKKKRKLSKASIKQEDRGRARVRAIGKEQQGGVSFTRRQCVWRGKMGTWRRITPRRSSKVTHRRSILFEVVEEFLNLLHVVGVQALETKFELRASLSILGCCFFLNRGRFQGGVELAPPYHVHAI